MKTRILGRLIVLAMLTLPGIGRSEDSAPPVESGSVQADWGIGVAVRTAPVPYVSDNDTVSSFVPMLFHEGDRWFMRGIAGGLHLTRDQPFELNAIGRLRFMDIPAEYQNTLQGDNVDFGLQLHQEQRWGWWEAELLTEDKGNWQANARIGHSQAAGRWSVSYDLTAEFASADFVSHYYALEPLTRRSADASLNVSAGLLARYDLWSDLHLIGALRYRAYGSEIKSLPTIHRSDSYEAWLGFGFFQDRGTPQFLGKPAERIVTDRSIPLRPNLRVMHAWATPSSLGEVLSGNIKSDPYNNQMTSIFYEYPLTDRLFNWPVQIMLGTGYAQHWSSAVQDQTFELAAKIHLYYTFNWPIRVRLGAAEGFSWIEEPTYMETLKMTENGYRTSKLLNFLNFTLDINAGDLLRSRRLHGVWFGVSTHHRSAIFESASQFGRISGGSDYPGFHLYWDL